MDSDEISTVIEDAILDFTMGDNEIAVSKLEKVLKFDDQQFDAWHALTEIYYADKENKKALESAQKAHQINAKDVHINTSLSRIWLALGDKEQAEHFGAQARMLGWKEELKNPEEDDVIESS